MFADILVREKENQGRVGGGGGVTVGTITGIREKSIQSYRDEPVMNSDRGFETQFDDPHRSIRGCTRPLDSNF